MCMWHAHVLLLVMVAAQPVLRTLGATGLAAQVFKFVGKPYKKGTGVEALLDIEFEMGVAPGVKTEFWEW